MIRDRSSERDASRTERDVKVHVVRRNSLTARDLQRSYEMARDGGAKSRQRKSVVGRETVYQLANHLVHLVHLVLFEGSGLKAWNEMLNDMRDRLRASRTKAVTL